MAAKQSQAWRGQLREHEPMAQHTSWRVGGPADRFFRPADLEDLAAFLAALSPAEPVYWVGLGSNLLVREGGIRGTVICTSGMLGAIELRDGDCIRVEAGVSCAKLARHAAQAGLVGAEFFSGIPGTVGGALAMNAGAFGGETWMLVHAVETIDRCGRVRRRERGEYQIGYRSCRPPAVDEWFVAAHLQLRAGDGEQSRAQIRRLLAKRNATQPIGEHSCGSVFRNPKGDYAARLIEASGLKGYCIGGACVSKKHANFIVNGGAASAADIESLVNYVADAVAAAHGVRLIPEVRIVGEPAGSADSCEGEP